MRILGGVLRGRRLAGPSAEGTRPTAGRVKSALFNILAPRIADARFLDLYAGTGLVGIEALSRGAGHVTFVESNIASCHVIKSNLERCGGYARASKVLTMPASRFLKQAHRPYDIVFVDPPYHGGEDGNILPLLGSGAIIAANGVVVIEHFHKVHLPVQVGRLAFIKSYRHGDTLLSVYRHGSQADSV
ncbi:MAG TPA: 16S rRNA (guanine(966)-N(2))-methyltransferase RsmD [Nitrospirales bacterium]